MPLIITRFGPAPKCACSGEAAQRSLNTGTEASWVCGEGVSESGVWLIKIFDPYLN